MVILLIFLECTRSHQLPMQGPRCTCHALYRKPPAAHAGPRCACNTLHCKPPAAHPRRGQVHLLQLQATHLQHNNLLRKTPAAHTGTQVRFDTLHCKPPAAHAETQVHLLQRYKQLTCNTTPSPTMTRVTVWHVKVFLLIFLEITRSHQLPTQGPRCTCHAFYRKPPAAHAGPRCACNTLHCKPPAAHPRREPGALATSNSFATQHLTPQATSCPHRDPGAL